MRSNSCQLKVGVCLFCSIFLLFSVLLPPNAIGQKAKKNMETERFVSIDFNNVDINVFIMPCH